MEVSMKHFYLTWKLAKFKINVMFVNKLKMNHEWCVLLSYTYNNTKWSGVLILTAKCPD